MPSRARFTLRFKIMTLVLVSVVATATMIAGADYFSARQVAVDNALQRLGDATHLATSKVKGAFDQMKNDAFVLSQTLPIMGIARSSVNNGMDPEDGSTTELWRTRLATIFRSLISARPHYTQIRYIGANNDGQEIVRVDRESNGEIVTISGDSLQIKKNREYFIAGTQTPPGRYYISPIGYNTEQGRVTPDRIPTVRLVLPIYEESKILFGLIVIDANYELLLRPVLEQIPEQYRVYVSDHKGTYIQRDSKGNIFDAQVAGHYSKPSPVFIDEFTATPTGRKDFSEGGLFGYRDSVALTYGKRNAAVGTVLLTPKSALLGPAERLASRALFIGGAVLIVTLTLAALFANVISRPVAEMTEAISAYGTPFYSAKKLPTHYHGEIGDMASAFHDLTERLEKTQQVNSELSLQLESFVAKSVDGVVIIDETGIIERINSSVTDVFGYDAGELIGKNVSILMPEPARTDHDGHLQRYRDTERKTYIDTLRDEKALHKDGTVFPITLAVSEVKTAERRLFFAMIRDMTAWVQKEAEIRQYMAELERSNSELDQFAYVASHDLKAPLRVIENTSNWLAEDLEDKLTAKDRKHLNVLQSRVIRMEKLLDDLLEYSRIGRSVDSRYSEELTGAEMIQDILGLLGPPSSFKVDIAPELSDVRVVRMPLQQVIYNLIANALKHHDRDEGTIAVSVEQVGTQYRFTVSDDGPGIPERFHEQVFEMFRTLKPRDQVEGSGMGLALVKKTVEYFGGTVDLQSKEGYGAKFSFTWPVNSAAPKKKAAA